MIRIENLRVFGSGDRVVFDTRFIDRDTGVTQLLVLGVKAINGKIYGPSFKLANGDFMTCVHFEADFVDAIVQALDPWVVDEHFKAVRWPRPPKNVVTGDVVK